MIEFKGYTTCIYNGTNWIFYTPYIAEPNSSFVPYTPYIAENIPIIDAYTFPSTITSLTFERR